MKEPSFLDYVILVTVCLAMALVGLYLLANFNRLLRGSIKNAFLRRNVAAWGVIFLLNGAMAPISGGFFYIVLKFGWWGTIAGHFISTTVATLIGFNVVWAIAENKRLKRLSFIKHKLLLFFTLIIMTLLVNVPFSYVAFDHNIRFISYTIISSIYVGGSIGLVYALISYLDIERKRKFDEKELELTRLRELKAKAELDALHSKVNPHFLYNALNSIADLSITDGKKARKMTVALADLFRYSINYSNNNFSTIKEEIEMAEVYLQIEKIRFEDQLNYRINVDEKLNYYLVPRFVIQPLVENAVKHGLKTTGQLTEIILEVVENGDGIIINVADTGPVFPEELNPGYGVKSVYDKLDLLFPGNYEIRFNNLPRKQVSIHIKKMVKNEPAL
ncbi:MAG: sensor histidine kinase [Chitinophagaceae bacterium]